ncbi:AsmA family protein [Magnetovibrio blakemorei]|uniref:AsmA family protein n=1 Tax=Magnetovibrio blakemorei TaxID=28181 RepID=UPI00148109B1|nr:AsmA family protein [Magnetovibrio blakemorei]
MAKKFLIGVLVVVALLAGVAIIGPSFIDSNALKQQATAQVRAATGRDLTIDGDLQISIFPSPTLTANSVTLTNAAGAAEDNMVSLKAVEVRVALMPLLSGKVQVERIRLVGAVVNIEKFADGRTNLEFQPQPQTQTQSKTGQTSLSVPQVSETAENTDSSKASGAGEAGMDIRLDNFELVDSRLIYRDDTVGTVERIDDIDAMLRAVSLNGPFEAKGQARVRGVPLAFEVSLGQIIKERTVPVNAVVNAPGGARAQVTGAVLNLESTPRFRGKIKVQGENLAQLLNAALGAPSTPALLGQTFALDSAIDASAADVGLSELEIQLGKSRVTGSVQAALSEGVSFDVKLKSALIDVDEMLKMAASETKNAPSAQGATPSSASVATAPADASKDAPAPAKPQPFAFPSDLRGTVQVTVDAVAVNGGLVNDVRLVAELADGELALSQFQAMAPGVTEVGVFGFARPKEGVLRFEGDVDVTCADPSSLTAWLGVKLPSGVAERVKRVTYKSKVTADAKQVVVSGLNVTADKSTLTGGVTLALRKRLSFGADLALNEINLDTYLNGGTHPSAAPAEGASKQASGAKASPAASSTMAQDVADMADAWNALSALNDFDANLKVRVGTLVQDGKTLKNLSLDGTLYAGALTLRSLQLGDFQGASANLSGTFTSFGKIPEMAKVKVTAKVKDAQKLAADFGAAGLPKGLKAVALNATAEGSVLKPRFEAQVNALEGDFGAKGSFSVLPIAFGFDGTVSAKHPNLDTLLNALDVGFNPAGPLGALDLKAQLTTDGKTHKLTQLKSTLGGTAINGDILANTGGEKPQVTANLQTGVLALDRFLPKAQGKAQLDQPMSKVASKWGKRPEVSNVIFAAFDNDQLAAASAKVNERWSRERFDLSALNMLDGDFSLMSEAIQFGDYALTSADIHATVKDGVMTADKIKGAVFGGPLNGSATVRASGTPTVTSNIKLDALKVREAVQAVAKQDLASGNLSMNMAFKATGLSPADLVGSLGGTGSLNISQLDVKKGGKGSALSGVLGLVAAMNQLSLGSKTGNGLADLALSFDVQDGVATAHEMKLTSAMGNGTGAGTVDIAGWGIDVAGNMTVEPNLVTSLLSKGRVGRQQLPFALKGALDNPAVNLGLNKASTGSDAGAPQQKLDPLRSLLQNALPGAKAPQQDSVVNPQQPDGTLVPPPPAADLAPAPKPQKPSAQDLIQKLMKGL